MREDGIEAPRGPDELFRQYFGYIRRIVANTPAIPAQDAEDVAMEIMTRLVERDVLGMFDPRMQFAHEGKQIPAKFRTFLTAQVGLYVKGQRDRLGRQRKREVVASVMPDDESEAPSLFDLIGGAEDDLSAFDAAEWIRQAREFLALVPKRSDQDRCDLVKLFDEMIDQVSRTGAASTSETAARLGVSPSVVTRWTQWMRQNLRQQAALSRRIQIDGQTYTVAHARQAASLLRAVKGQPHVKQALVRAGSPLALMDYHRIARAERAMYPEVKVPPGDHHKPAPHVLNAVVHRLERAIEPALT